MSKFLQLFGALAILLLVVHNCTASTTNELESGQAEVPGLLSFDIPVDSAPLLSRDAQAPLRTISNSSRNDRKFAPVDESDIPNTKWPVRFWGMLIDETGLPVGETKCTADFTVGSNEFGTAFTTSPEGLFDFVFVFPNPIEVIDTIKVAIFSEGLGPPNGMGGWRIVTPPRSAMLSSVIVPLSQEVPLGPLDLSGIFEGLSGVAFLNEEPLSDHLLHIEYQDSRGRNKQEIQIMTDEEGRFVVSTTLTTGYYKILPIYLPAEGKNLSPTPAWAIPVGTHDLNLIFGEL